MSCVNEDLNNKNLDNKETKLDYLYDLYKCNDLSVLEARCPINTGIINVNSEATKELKEMISFIEEKENEAIAKVIEKRSGIKERYTLDEIENLSKR